MKKVLALLLAVMMLTSFVACSSAPAVQSVNEKELLEKVWASYAEDEKFFAMGGDYNNMVDNAPGACDVTDAETLNALFGFPTANIADIDGAASLMHAMNQNTFTAGAYHMVTTDKQALADAIKENIQNRQWMCGFPDTLLIASVGDCMVVAFGEASIMDNFKAKLTAAYDFTEVLYEESLA